MLLSAWEKAKDFWLWFPRSAAWLLLFTGIIAITWFIAESKERAGIVKTKQKSYLENDKLKNVRKALSIIGLVWGIIIIISAVVGLIRDIPPSYAYAYNLGCPDPVECNGNNNFTSLSLILLGMICFLRPIRILPLHSVFGFIGGAIFTICLAIFVPVPEIVSNWRYWKFAIIVIFFIVSALTAVALKMSIDTLVLISKIASWPPVTLIIVVFSIVQGVLLLTLGVSMIAW